MLNNLNMKIEKLNSNINDIENNKKAKRLKIILLIAGIFVILLGVACVILSIYFIISGFSFNFDIASSYQSYFKVANKSIIGFILFLPAILFFALGSSLILSSMKIAYVNISSHLNKMALKKDECVCQYCGSVNEKGRANCQNCGAPIKTSKENDSSN